MQDLYKKYLIDESQSTRQRALTSSSYKTVYLRENGASLSDKETNKELATYGDALLKFAFCKILFRENVENITEEKKKYESDKVFVEVIAKHYDLLKYIRFDKRDKKIPQDYNYRKGDNNSPSKYIATVVEALIAAIYLDNEEDFNIVLDIARLWKKRIDGLKTSEEEFDDISEIKLVGQNVKHYLWGEGIVTAQTNSDITVEFPEKTSKFLLPEAFKKGYLSL